MYSGKKYRSFFPHQIFLEFGDADESEFKNIDDSKKRFLKSSKQNAYFQKLAIKFQLCLYGCNIAI